MKMESAIENASDAVDPGQDGVGRVSGSVAEAARDPLVVPDVIFSGAEPSL